MLTSGSHLGPYEILGAIGAGGMGEVYRARDPRLNRTVAIKILASLFQENPDRRERFLREAQAVAALEHPHICVLHDIGLENGVDFLVMEHLEGETLAARLEKARRPGRGSSGLATSDASGAGLPVAEALRIGIDIASALDAAQRHGIVHRDLKPGNIMLTRSGAKLLDFGLAKLRPAVVAAVSMTMPAQAAPLTGEGSILGTLQ
jgi:serine/threonine protein kinase